ncbi:MAG TPA: DUF72 domain-containing protein [Solirubrobacterales bacterium]|nr:DUF72 domain-containing protein [Solirubrobacterales bacterium]
MKDVRIGCSGWVYASWREGIYEGVPQARWLERYAELFDTVEVNATFYRLIKRSTVEGWVERTPPGFLFAVKASRYLTHIRRLRDVEQGIARFWEPLEPLREAAGLASGSGRRASWGITRETPRSSSSRRTAGTNQLGWRNSKQWRAGGSSSRVEARTASSRWKLGGSCHSTGPSLPLARSGSSGSQNRATPSSMSRSRRTWVR